MRQPLTEPEASSTRFNTLISLVCQEHFDCLRALRDELTRKPLSVTHVNHHHSSTVYSSISNGLSAASTGSVSCSPSSLEHIENMQRLRACARRYPSEPAAKTLAGGDRPTASNGTLTSFRFTSADSFRVQTDDSTPPDDADQSSEHSVPCERNPVTNGLSHTPDQGHADDVDVSINGSNKHNSIVTADTTESPEKESLSIVARESSKDFEPRETSRSIMSRIESRLLAGHFRLLPAWEEQDFDVRRTSFALGTQNNRDSSRSSLIESTVSAACCRLWMLHPNSGRRLLWELLCLFVLTHDLIVVPLYAFDIQETVFLATVDWIARVVWTLDIPLTFFVGFYRKGALYMSFQMAARNYLRTWFAIDAGLVCTDWLFFFWSPNIGNQGLLKSLRLVRFGRIVRLLRLLKFQRLLLRLEDLVSTESIAVHFNCTKPVVGMLLLVHALGCGWYAVGVWAERNDPNNWLTESKIRQRSKAFQYATSLHWALSQFTLNSNDVCAQNVGERVYTIFVLVIGIVVFSSLIGFITSAVEQLRELKSDETKQFSLLRRFLKDYDISHQLSARIIRYCQYAYTHRKSRKQESEVSLLLLMSDQLRQELESEIHTPSLKPHPLFELMVKSKFSCWDKICANSLSVLFFARGDSIFTRGVACKGMFIFAHGQASYSQSDRNGGKKRQRLNTTDWVCEPSLWLLWITLGSARAEIISRVVMVDAGWLQQVLSNAEPGEWSIVNRYASEFVDRLNLMQQEDLSDVMEAAPIPDDMRLSRTHNTTDGMQFFARGIFEQLHSRVSRRVSRVSRNSFFGKITTSVNL